MLETGNNRQKRLRKSDVGIVPMKVCNATGGKTNKEAVKALAKPVELSIDEQAAAIKKHHISAMGKASKLGETLRGLDTTHISSEEVVSWKTYLDDVKESILVLEKELGYE
ncbi:hypothetical protein AU255_06150 [Methyloprofundus sedimenti]|uniref:Uncharacterized protein n=2 Tax=Methyloprofundus sedimenti TaxID=1420851 RepID=A0A1V8M7F7_9GAMM|nr:hypothetical protein AU255_06150 [Methyloprofundus sedimenti]